MEWLSVIGLIVFGIALIVVEVIFVPGTTFVGIGGFACAIFGVYLSYQYFGGTIGSSILLISFIGGITATVLAFRSGAWEKFSLKDEHTAHFNDDYRSTVKVGDLGESISSLKPFGKAIFNDQVVEVKSDGSWINEGQSIQIIKMDSTKIIVEAVTTA